MGSAVAVKLETAVTVRSFARDLMAESDNDVTKAKRLARERLSCDHALREELTRPLIEAAIDSALDTEWRALRMASWHKPRVLQTGELSTPSPRLRAGYEQMLMDYQMPEGKRLRDCTKAELEKWSALMLEQGKTTMERGRWFALIASELPRRDALVGKALAEADLKRLQRKAMKG